MMNFKITTQEKRKMVRMLKIAIAGIGLYLLSTPIREWFTSTFKESQYFVIGAIILIGAFYVFNMRFK